MELEVKGETEVGGGSHPVRSCGPSQSEVAVQNGRGGEVCSLRLALGLLSSYAEEPRTGR